VPWESLVGAGYSSSLGRQESMVGARGIPSFDKLRTGWLVVRGSEFMVKNPLPFGDRVRVRGKIESMEKDKGISPHLIPLSRGERTGVRGELYRVRRVSGITLFLVFSAQLGGNKP